MGEEIRYVIVWNKKTSEVIEDITEDELDDFLESEKGKGFQAVWKYRKLGEKNSEKMKPFYRDGEKIEEMYKRWIRELREDPRDTWERKFSFSGGTKETEEKERK